MQQSSAKRDLRLLLPSEVRATWPKLRAILEPVEAHCHGEILIDDILDLVDQRKAFVLAMSNGDELELVGVMEVIDYPRKRVMNTIMMAGRGNKYFFSDCRVQAASIAKALGASCIRGAMRPAVSRLLRKNTPRAREIYSIVEIDL